MTDLNRLKAVIDERGMPVRVVAERAEIPRYTLDRRLKGEGDFTATEIVGLTRALRLTKAERDKIFLNRNVN